MVNISSLWWKTYTSLFGLRIHYRLCVFCVCCNCISVASMCLCHVVPLSICSRIVDASMQIPFQLKHTSKQVLGCCWLSARRLYLWCCFGIFDCEQTMCVICVGQNTAGHQCFDFGHNHIKPSYPTSTNAISFPHSSYIYVEWRC